MEIQMPEPWSDKLMAGSDWFTSFLKRNQDLSIRTPEATSLARASSFNEINVSTFFNKLKEIYERKNFTAADVWNFDETGVTTVQKPVHVAAPRGSKQVGKMTSGQRGTLVTVGVAGSAIGNSIPPIIVFPRVNFKDHFIREAPSGSVKVANSSGWMIESHFVEFARHFVKFVHPSKDKPVLLLMDNHSSHLSIEALDIFKKNGVTVLSFPPHCSHKLQPLDRTVYGPFKKFINSFSNLWMTTNPGKTMTIYDLPKIVTQALPLACTPRNIMAGFRVSGIWPFNPDIFTEDEFLPAFSTDRPNPENEMHIDQPNSENAIQPGPSRGENQNENVNVSLEEVRPFPKAGPRTGKRRGRKSRESAILTDSPDKLALQVEKETSQIKKQAQGSSKKIASSKRKVSTSVASTNKKLSIKRAKKNLIYYDNLQLNVNKGIKIL